MIKRLKSRVYQIGGMMRHSNWSDARIWLAFTLIGFLGPVLVAVFFRGAFGEIISFNWVARSGQFSVSSAALLMTTAYFVARPSSMTKIRFHEWFFVIAIAGSIAGAAFHALATLAGSGIVVNSAYYEVPSMLLFLVALVAAFIAVGLDREREISEDGFLPRGVQAKRDQLAEDFDSSP